MQDSIYKNFSALYDPIHFPVQVINENGNIVYINLAFSLQWGYNLAELKEYSIFNDPELKKNGVLTSVKNVFKNKTYAFLNNYSDSLLLSKELAVPIFRTKIFFVNVEDEKFLILFHEDQTEMVLTEEEVKKARDATKEAERLKDTFLNVLSHELRTPLNIILGYSSIIKESMKDKISSEDKVYLDNLYSGSERLFKSITQMLDFAQIEAGNYKLNLETTDLNLVINNCLEGIRETAVEKKLDVKTHFKKDKIFVDIDLQCLENAVSNLLNNAVKFTRQGFVEIELSVLEDRDLAVCKIKDSGVGISTEYMDHLFRPFSQEDLNIGRNYEGNGLGLALAKRYIEKMGGALLVDSIKGVGSTVTFTLPLSQNYPKPEKNNEVLEEKKEKKILMIDNFLDTYELINAFLKNSYTINAVGFREFDIEALKSKEYQVIIFDVNQNHWEQSLIVCKDLKKHDPYKRPIIIVSSEYIHEKITQFYEAGADKFLVKPFSKNELFKAIDETVIQ